MPRHPRSLTLTDPPARLLAPVPRWLAPVLTGWFGLALITLTMATGLPFHAEVLLAGAGLLALGHGLVHRRWWVAGPVGLIAAIGVGWSVLGALPPGVSLSYSDGPAGSPAPTLIWATLTAVTGLNIGWAWFLHARVRRTLLEPAG